MSTVINGLVWRFMMSRAVHPPRTRLGVALRSRRGELSLTLVSEDAGVPWPTLSRLERGTHRPSADTARKLATWLGWTVEEVLVAADELVGPT